MSSYARVAHGMWGDDRFRRLTALRPSGQALWIHLITGPHNRGVPGLFRLSKTNLVEELGWTLKEVERCFAEIETLGMAFADWSARVVWLPRGPRHDRPGNPNVVAGWWRQLSPLPECDLLKRALQSLREYCGTEGVGWVQAFDKALRKAFHEGFLSTLREGCNARVPSPYPSPSPSASGGSLSSQERDGGHGPISEAQPRDPVPGAEDTSPVGDPALMRAWNAARSKFLQMPPSRMTEKHRTIFADLRAAFGEDEALCIGTIDAYHAKRDPKLKAAGHTVNLWAWHVDGAMAEAIDGRKKATPAAVPWVYPRVSGATEAELKPYARRADDPFTAEDESRIAAEIGAKRAGLDAPAETEPTKPGWRPPLPVFGDVPRAPDANAAKAEGLRAAHGITPEQEAEARRRIADERRDQSDKTAGDSGATTEGSA